MLGFEMSLNKILNPKAMIIVVIATFIVGFFIGELASYLQWVRNIETTIIYVEDYDFVEDCGKSENITYISSLVVNARKEFEFKNYRNTVKILTEINSKCESLQLDNDFQRLLKKIT